MSQAKRPRWRWATRDGRKDSRLTTTRYLWTVRPVYSKRRRWWILPDRYQQRGDGVIRYQAVEASDFRKRFGRDLRPGQSVRLPFVKVEMPEGGEA